MSIIRENNKNRGKVYRCFVIFNCDRQEFIYIQKRRCHKSYESSNHHVKNQAEYCFSRIKLQKYLFRNGLESWIKQKCYFIECYFILMLFPKTNIQLVNEALNQLIKLISSIPNYYHLTSEQLDQLKRSDIRKLIDKLENEYIEKDGIMGNPSDDEQAGSKIISVNPIKLNPQSSFRSNLQLQQSKNDTREFAQTQTLDKKYIEFGVYRAFAIFSVKLQKIIFQLRRGSKSAINDIEKLLKSKSNNPEEYSIFIEKINSKTEWHGKYHKPDQCYYLIMTFLNADIEECNKTLKLAINRFSKNPHFVQQSLEELNEKYLWDICNLLKSSERHYEYDLNYFDVPSDDEIIPQLDILKQSTFGLTKNYSSFSASKRELKQMQILPRTHLIQLGETELDSPIQTKVRILNQLENFEPLVNDIENILQYGVFTSLVILLTIFAYLILK